MTTPPVSPRSNFPCSATVQPGTHLPTPRTPDASSPRPQRFPPGAHVALLAHLAKVSAPHWDAQRHLAAVAACFGHARRLRIELERGLDCTLVERGEQAHSGPVLTLALPRTAPRQAAELPAPLFDAFVGRTLIATRIAASLDRAAWTAAAKQAGTLSGDPAMFTLAWSALLSLEARAQIALEWPGLAPALAAEACQGAQYHRRVQAYLHAQALAPCAQDAMVAVAWSLLHPALPLDLTPRLRPGVDAALAVATRLLGQRPALDVAKEVGATACALLPVAAGKPAPLGFLLQVLPASPSASEDPPSSSAALEAQEDPTAGGALEELRRLLVGSPTPSEAEACSASPEGEPDESCPADDASQPVAHVDHEMTACTPPAHGPAAYRALVSRLQPVIRRVQQALEFLPTAAETPAYGERRGEVDEGALHKLAVGDDRCMWRRDEERAGDIAVGLLVDQSGSMSDEIDEARDVAVTLLEACKAIRGIDTCVYGHSTEPARPGEPLWLGTYVSPDLVGNEAALMGMDARHNNMDGYAIDLVAREMHRHYPRHARRLLFVISDGQPSGPCGNYSGEMAANHMRTIVKAARAAGVEVYGIGVSHAFSQDWGERAYGPGRVTILSDVRSSLGVMAGFLRKVTRTL